MTDCANGVDIPKDERCTTTSVKEIRTLKVTLGCVEGNRKKWFSKKAEGEELYRAERWMP